MSSTSVYTIKLKNKVIDFREYLEKEFNAEEFNSKGKISNDHISLAFDLINPNPNKMCLDLIFSIYDYKVDIIFDWSCETLFAGENMKNIISYLNKKFEIIEFVDKKDTVEHFRNNNWKLIEEYLTKEWSED